MNKTQKTILAVGLLLMALAALFPPSVYFGPTDGYAARGFLYTRDFTGKPCSIDGQKLAVEWMFLATVTAFGTVLAKRHNTNNNEVR
jgi:hypothetical protein